MNKTRLLFIVILVEGYVVLAAELLAIRQLIPFVGSGTETISIIISAVLMPLAVGYHAGGQAFRKQYRKARAHRRRIPSVRRLLFKNVVIALLFFSVGLSYLFMEAFFDALGNLGISHRLLQTTVYSLFFLVYPVFLLGQTVPLISNYFSRRRLSEITGRMLFFSTTGSFLGSVFSTIVLMTYIGVHNTVIVTMGLLAGLALLLTRRIASFKTIGIALIMALLLLLNSNAAMRGLNIVSNNAYNTVSIVTLPYQEAVIFNANRSASSKISKNPEHNFEYWKYVQAVYLNPIARATAPRDILILGAGGFTIGLHDARNRYVYVDIDAALKDVAEAHFLPEKLTPNKRFIPASARAFVRSHEGKYDFILIDTYTNMISIPQETTTREFLLDVKKLLKPGGILVANIISAPDFRETFTVRYHNTFTSVFPVSGRQVIGPFNPWPGQQARRQPQMHNVLYTYYHHAQAEDRTVYTDDKNPYSLDR